ncbi:MAG: Cof-type HAD-IIB family hydrolase [Defluviitaleaceae bacterium]|nr:Cof-type HAD-IIB family hydrolase [Defluviitaleaceae bacterium]
MKKYKMIFVDVDGTLCDVNHKVSEKNKKAIHKAIKNNIDIVLCSGRTPVSLITICEEIVDYNAKYFIGFNGASILKNNPITDVYKNTLDKDLSLEILERLEKHAKNDSDICIATYPKPEQIIMQNAPDNLGSIMDKEIEKINIKENISKHINTDVRKIMAVSENEKLQNIAKDFKSIIKDRYTMVFTSPYILEFVPINVNKGSAISFLCEHIGISLDDVVTFGDSFNDIEMIKLAGLGVAIENAVEELKECANYITKSDCNNSALEELVDYVIELNNK